MKKIKLFSLFIIIVISLMILTSCNQNTLSCPENLKVNLDNVLSWDVNNDARSYIISVSNNDSSYNEEFNTRNNKYDLNKLTEGDYVIKVRAVQDYEAKNLSEWSSEYFFHKSFDNGAKYTLINNNSEYELSSGQSCSGDIIIEDTYRGLPITSIGDSAFKGNNKITSIKLNDSIKTIGKNAFYNCSNLENVSLSKNIILIGESAFQACRSLKSIRIPDTINSISSNAFAYCRSLTSINFSNNIKSIGENAFYNCSGLTEVVLPDELISIENEAFGGCSNLKTITINSKLETIPTSCFQACTNLVNVKFSNKSNLKQIENKAFYDCSNLSEIVLPDGLEKIGSNCFTLDVLLEKVSIPDSIIEIGSNAFLYTTLYSSAKANNDRFIYADKWIVGINDTVSEDKKTTVLNKDYINADTIGIADYVFANNSSLVTVNLPSSVKYIGNRAFLGCSNITKVTTNGCVQIGDGAFSGCLTAMFTLNKGLVKIGNYAFYGCKSLVNRKINGEIDLSRSVVPNTVTEIGTRAFENTGLWDSPDQYGVIYAGNWIVGCVNPTATIEITLSNVAGISNYAFYQENSIQSIHGLNKVERIGYAAFYGCSSLARVSFNSNLLEIPDYAFYNCNSLYSVALPTNIRKIGKCAFYKCSDLTEIDFSTGYYLEEISDYAFAKCNNLKTLTFQNSIKIIGEGAFYKCSELKNITLPNSLTSLGTKAFYKCTNLVDIILGNGIEEIPSYCFLGVGALKIEIPNSVKIISNYAFYDTVNLEYVVLNEGLEEIGAYSFRGALKLKNIYLPSTLKSIGNFAFKDCMSLDNLFLGSKLETIGKHAFYNCNNLTLYTELQSKTETWNTMFNSSNRPIIYNSSISEDLKYIIEFKFDSSYCFNINEFRYINDPTREGYVFEGWEVTYVDEEGNNIVKIFKSDELINLANGSEVKAIWKSEN